MCTRTLVKIKELLMKIEYCYEYMLRYAENNVYLDRSTFTCSIILLFQCDASRKLKFE